jgi:membrane-associated phospholipid phosphatase
LHEHWVAVMSWMYDSLWFELTLIPLALIAMHRQDLLRELYSFVLISCIIGFTWYYLFPTTAPASAFGGEAFMPQQHATGIKFYEIHHYISPSTDDGGLISFPSFHVIFAWSMVYVMRGWKKLCWLLSFWNLGITISCVVLGWHYLIDIIGSAGVMMMSFGLERLCVYDTSDTFRR